jgi:hypothetical protein
VGIVRRQNAVSALRDRGVLAASITVESYPSYFSIER